MIGALLNDCDRSGTDDPAALSADVLQTAGCYVRANRPLEYCTSGIPSQITVGSQHEMLQYEILQYEMLQTGAANGDGRCALSLCSDRFNLTGHLPPEKARGPDQRIRTSHPRTSECKPGSASKATNNVVIVSLRSVPVTQQCYAVVRWQFVGSHSKGTSSVRSERFPRSFEFRVQGSTYSVQGTAFRVQRSDVPTRPAPQKHTHIQIHKPRRASTQEKAPRRFPHTHTPPHPHTLPQPNAHLHRLRVDASRTVP